MIRRPRPAARLLLAASLLYGSGAHWLLVQGAAWAGMLAARSSRGAISAVSTTFDGAHPCRVCRLVKRGAAADAAPRAGASSPAVRFAFAAAPALVPAVEAASLGSSPAPSFACAPPVPPSPPPDLLRVA